MFMSPQVGRVDPNLSLQRPRRDMNLLHDLIQSTADRLDDLPALTFGRETLNYGALADRVSRFAAGLMALGLARSERVAVYLEKREETVVCAFGASAAGGVFVPINPLLKPDQVAYILRDCNVRVLVTSAERWPLLEASLGECHDLRHIVLTAPAPVSAGGVRTVHGWENLLEAPRRTGHRVIDVDMAAIFYTSGSTGKPKGVVLSHRNLVAGALSAASDRPAGTDVPPVPPVRLLL